MEQIHGHATCRVCSWEDRTDQPVLRGRDHAEKNHHRVTVKITYSSEIPPGGDTA